jgi:hypothetical protein
MHVKNTVLTFQWKRRIFRTSVCERSNRVWKFSFIYLLYSAFIKSIYIYLYTTIYLLFKMGFYLYIVIYKSQ